MLFKRIHYQGVPLYGDSKPIVGVAVCGLYGGHDVTKRTISGTRQIIFLTSKTLFTVFPAGWFCEIISAYYRDLLCHQNETMMSRIGEESVNHS